MVRVPDCSVLQLEVNLDIDRDVGRRDVAISVQLAEGDAELVDMQATMDGEPIDGAWTGDGFDISLSDLPAGRHTLRAQVTDANGQVSESVHVPFWMDAEAGTGA